MTNVWLAKYALSAGIKEIDAEIDEDGYCREKARFGGFYRMGKDAFLNRDGAVMSYIRETGAARRQVFAGMGAPHSRDTGALEATNTNVEANRRR